MLKIKKKKEEIEARFWLKVAEMLREFLVWTMENFGDGMTVEQYLECRELYNELTEAINLANGVEVEEWSEAA